MSDKVVANYIEEHFVCNFQKVSSFSVLERKSWHGKHSTKVGGNVAAYFCLPDGRVIHAVAGPVTPQLLLNEARWVVDLHNMAMLESDNKEAAYSRFLREAHVERLLVEHGIDLTRVVPIEMSASKLASIRRTARQQEFFQKQRNLASPRKSHATLVDTTKRYQWKVHQLLVENPLPPLGQIYKPVFESILNQNISTVPVNVVER
ncbi:MAG: hypothetical protein KatS3mg105_1653 [Gemmatales bacterium]|nr:MAG: hypothetical protein KatS3mg105_1653 [Gemmatales bacterium]